MRHIGTTGAIMVAALLAVGYARLQEKPQPPELGVTAPKLAPGESTRPIRADEYVQFSEGGFACVKREDLRELLKLTQQGDQTRARDMIASDKNSDAPCAWLSPQRRYKVMSANYASGNQNVGLLEVAAEGVRVQHGAWALSVGAVPVTATKAATAAAE